MKCTKSKLTIIIIIVLLVSCGTLGHIQFYYFYSSKYDVKKDLLNIIGDSTHTVPNKWKENAVGLDFLDEEFIYFKNNPEEIYRVGFTGDSAQWNNESSCRLGLVGVYDGAKWKFNRDLSSSEEERMMKRFETEILSKMKHYYKKE